MDRRGGKEDKEEHKSLGNKEIGSNADTKTKLVKRWDELDFNNKEEVKAAIVNKSDQIMNEPPNSTENKSIQGNKEKNEFKMESSGADTKFSGNWEKIKFNETIKSEVIEEKKPENKMNETLKSPDKKGKPENENKIKSPENKDKPENEDKKILNKAKVDEEKKADQNSSKNTENKVKIENHDSKPLSEKSQQVNKSDQKLSDSSTKPENITNDKNKEQSVEISKSPQKAQEEKKHAENLSESKIVENKNDKKNQKANTKGNESALKPNQKQKTESKPNNSPKDPKMNEGNLNKNQSVYTTNKISSKSNEESKSAIPRVSVQPAPNIINNEKNQESEQFNPENQKDFMRQRALYRLKMVNQKLNILSTHKYIFYLLINTTKRLNYLANKNTIIVKQMKIPNFIKFKAFYLWKLNRKNSFVYFSAIRKLFNTQVFKNQEKLDFFTVKNLIRWKLFEKKLQMLKVFSGFLSKISFKLMARKYKSLISSLFHKEFIVLKGVKKIELIKFKYVLGWKVLIRKAKKKFLFSAIKNSPRWLKFATNLNKKKFISFRQKLFSFRKNKLRWNRIVNKLRGKLLSFLKSFPKISKLCECMKKYGENSVDLRLFRQDFEFFNDFDYKYKSCRKKLSTRNSLRESLEQYNTILNDAKVMEYRMKNLDNEINKTLLNFNENEQRKIKKNREKNDNLIKNLKIVNDEISKINSKLTQVVNEVNSFDGKNSLLNKKKCQLLNSINKLESEFAESLKSKEEAEKEVKSLVNQIEVKKNAFEESSKKNELNEEIKKQSQAVREDSRKMYLAALRNSGEESKRREQRNVPGNILVNEFRGNIVVSEFRGNNASDRVAINGLLREISLLNAENDRLNYDLTSLRGISNSLLQPAVVRNEEISKTQVCLTVVCGILFAVFIRLYFFKS